MHERTLRVHEIEFVVETRPGFCDGGGVGKLGYRAVNGRKFAAWDAHGFLGFELVDFFVQNGFKAYLIVDSQLEASRTPLDEVEGGLGLEGCYSRSAVAWDDITTIKEGNCHVFAIAGIADNHLVVGLEAWITKLVRRSRWKDRLLKLKL
jgi:hypothetical protein